MADDNAHGAYLQTDLAAPPDQMVEEAPLAGIRPPVGSAAKFHEQRQAEAVCERELAWELRREAGRPRRRSPLRKLRIELDQHRALLDHELLDPLKDAVRWANGPVARHHRKYEAGNRPRATHVACQVRREVEAASLTRDCLFSGRAVTCDLVALLASSQQVPRDGLDGLVRCRRHCLRRLHADSHGRLARTWIAGAVI